MSGSDERSTDSSTERRLGRRTYLGAAVGTAALATFGVGTAAADEEYDVIEVPAGQTHTEQLGDGDVLENTVIDISADGARYQITASGSEWAIRNVGVRGVWDGSEKAEPIVAGVPDESGSARIENLYLGDGADDDVYPGATGIYVANNHAGTLKIDRVNIQGYPDNAIYGSSPGDLPQHPNGAGGGGAVEITNSYAADCLAGGFRVGTSGSYAENCVAVGCDRNFWGFYEETEIIDCDFSDGQIGDVGTGDSHWADDARVTVTDCRFETTVEHSGSVVGEPAGEPERTEPEDVDGVPLSAEDAARGESASDPDDDEPDEDEPDEDHECDDDHSDTDEPADDEPSEDEPDDDQSDTDEPDEDEQSEDEPDDDQPDSEEPVVEIPDDEFADSPFLPIVDFI